VARGLEEVGPGASPWPEAEAESDELIIDIGIGDDILVADDNEANLVAMEAALAPLGRRLVTVSSGVEALGKLLEQDFALILLDVEMPGLTGIETAKLIRSRERTRGTPILFVTGRTWQDDEIDKAYEVGGFDFLIKPVRAEVLRAKARVFLKLQERTRELHRKAEELRTSQAQLYEHELHEQRIRFESELLDAKLLQLSEGERRQHELAGIIGNELINPLQTLQMAFDLLREHPIAGTGERIHSLVEHRLVHVTRLVNVLIEVAQVASGQLRIHPEIVDMADIVSQAIEESVQVLEARKLSVTYRPEAGTRPLVMGDPPRLHQAITSLIDHMARAATEGDELVIGVSVVAGDAVIRVEGAGGGIAPALLPKIFDLCVNDTLPSGSALNLDLTLVKRLVDIHDGSVRAWSGGVGQGATFEIRLPLAPQDVEIPPPDPYTTQDVELPPDLYTTQDVDNTSLDELTETLRMPFTAPHPRRHSTGRDGIT
jgi:signal transduction histidine kinase